MDDETLEQIQPRSPFWSARAPKLSDVVFGLHKEIQVLEAKLKAVTDRLSGAQSDEVPRPPDQERPPHY